MRVRKFPLKLLKQQTDFHLTNFMPLPQNGSFHLYKNVLFTKSTTYLNGEVGLNCVNWYFQWAIAWKIDSTHVVFSREVCLISVDTGSQKIHEIPLHEIKVYKWCPMSATRNNRAIFFLRTLIHRNMSRMLWHLYLYSSPITRKHYFSLSLQQQSATAETTDSSILCSDGAFVDRVA